MGMDERKAAILRAVVEEYIDTAEPVGSGLVARREGVRVSPATVRNEMVSLEQEGYLHQPHTSAGRVPTDKGYRFFVDTLVGPAALGASQRQEVGRFFATAHGALEEKLRETSRLLASVTDYAAVVVGPPHEDATIRSVQLVGLGPRTALVVAVLSNGSVEKATLDLGDEVGEERLSAATAVLSEALLGSTFAALPTAGPAGDPVVDDIAAVAVRALRTGHDHEPEPVFVGGTSRVATAFDADDIRQVLTILEQQYVVVSLLRHVLDGANEPAAVESVGLRVAIGAEHGLEPLARCSVVVAPYQVGGEHVGTVGVLGPTRMHYPEALAAVAIVSARLSHSLAAG